MIEITSERANNLLNMLYFLAKRPNYTVTKKQDEHRTGYVHQGETYNLFDKNNILVAQLISKHGTFYYREVI